MMKTQTLSKHLLGAIKIGWFVFILIAMQPAATGQQASPQIAEEKSIRSVVTAFLIAWQKGDYATVHSLLDSKTRGEVTPHQLRNSFKLEPQGATAAEKRRLRAITGHSYLIAGKPMSVKAVYAKIGVNSEATADAVVDFSPLIDLGIDNPKLMTEFLNAILSDKKGSASKRDGFMRAMVVMALLTTETVNTAKGQTRDVKGTNGPPYVVIHLRRFHLIKESQGWRINNAVTIGSKAPASVRS